MTAPYFLKGVFSKARINYYELYRVVGGVPMKSIPIYSHAGVPTSGAAGTFFGVAEVAALLVDTTNKTLYQNTGTLAVPTWTNFTTASGSGAFTGSFDGTVGASTPADGKFTTLETSGLATLASATIASLTLTGLDTQTVATGLTASVTQTQVGALALTKKINNVTTVANANDAVVLPALAAGQSCDVYNNGAHPMKVFPAASGNIDGAGANAAVTLTNALRCRYTCVATNVIISTQLGAVSA